MPSVYPGDIDTWDTYDPGDTIHDSMIEKIQEAVAGLEALVGKTSSAVTTSHVYRMAALEAKTAFWNEYTGAAVFSSVFTATHTWQTLDLSAIVGSRAALCFFEMVDTGSHGYKFKPKDSAGGAAPSAFDQGADGNSSVYAVDFGTSGHYTFLIMPTDSDGCIEMSAGSTSSTLTIKLLGFV